MNAVTRIGTVLIAALAVCVSLPVAGSDLRDSLQSREVGSARISLNPWGPNLGFEIEIPGSDPRLTGLVDVIREAESGGGHKCSNTGAIRFRMKDGSVVGLGLLPSHTAGFYEFRLYDGERFFGVYRVERAVLLAALEDLGVPTDDPAFRE